MTPEEIRDLGLMDGDGDFDETQGRDILWSCARFLREIAAQLAELNKRLEAGSEAFNVYADTGELEATAHKIADRLQTIGNRVG